MGKKKENSTTKAKSTYAESKDKKSATKENSTTKAKSTYAESKDKKAQQKKTAQQKQRARMQKVKTKTAQQKKKPLCGRSRRVESLLCANLEVEDRHGLETRACSSKSQLGGRIKDRKFSLESVTKSFYFYFKFLISTEKGTSTRRNLCDQNENV